MSNIKKSQGGFTLIELLIVVLIIGILAAIAIPIFSGQRTKAKNSSALSTLQHAKQAATSFSIGNNENYACITPDKLLAEEESLEFSDANPPSPGGDANPKAVYIFASEGVPKTRITNANCNPTPSNPENSITRSGIILCTVSKGDKSYCTKQFTIGNSISPWINIEIDKEDLLEDKINNDATWTPDEPSNPDPGSGGSGTSQSNCEAAGGTWNTFEGMPGGYCMGQTCPDGQTWNSMTDPQSCIEPPTCPAGQVLMPGTVYCYTPMEPCPAGEYRDISGDCVPLGGGGPGLPGGSEYEKTNAYINLNYECDTPVRYGDFEENNTGLCGNTGNPVINEDIQESYVWSTNNPLENMDFESSANLAYGMYGSGTDFEALGFTSCNLNNVEFKKITYGYQTNCYNSNEGLILSGNNITDINLDSNAAPWSIIGDKTLKTPGSEFFECDDGFNVNEDCLVVAKGKLKIAVEYKCDISSPNKNLRIDYHGLVFNFNNGEALCRDDTQMGWN